jgi:peptide deformylase
MLWPVGGGLSTRPSKPIVRRMAIRQVVVWPDERLRQETKHVAEIDESVRQLYRDLCDTMYDENGLGIAAIQIGEAVKMFLVEPKLAGRDENDLPVCFINPEVVFASEETQLSDEGCLSFPDVFVQVERPMRARIRATGIDGQVFEVEGEGLLARCLLHEYDHLTGKLLVDFVGPLKRQMIKRKLQKVRDAAG